MKVDFEADIADGLNADAEKLTRSGTTELKKFSSGNVPAWTYLPRIPPKQFFFKPLLPLGVFMRKLVNYANSQQQR